MNCQYCSVEIVPNEGHAPDACQRRLLRQIRDNLAKLTRDTGTGKVKR